MHHCRPTNAFAWLSTLYMHLLALQSGDQQAIEAFKQKLQSQNVVLTKQSPIVCAGDVDATLLRFLRARKMNLEAATNMLLGGQRMLSPSIMHRYTAMHYTCAVTYVTIDRLMTELQAHLMWACCRSDRYQSRAHGHALPCAPMAAYCMRTPKCMGTDSQCTPAIPQTPACCPYA